MVIPGHTWSYLSGHTWSYLAVRKSPEWWSYLVVGSPGEFTLRGVIRCATPAEEFAEGDRDPTIAGDTLVIMHANHTLISPVQQILLN